MKGNFKAQFFALIKFSGRALRSRPSDNVLSKVYISMGYSTDFHGSLTIDPPLNAQEVEYLNKFANTRRMDRENGPYFVDGEGYRGQGHDKDVIDFNEPPEGQPGLWCKIEVTETELTWDGGEKTYDFPEWIQYYIDHFLAEGAKAKSELDFLQANHVLNGKFIAQGEDIEDRWKIEVVDNKITLTDLE